MSRDYMNLEHRIKPLILSSHFRKIRDDLLCEFSAGMSLGSE